MFVSRTRFDSVVVISTILEEVLQLGAPEGTNGHAIRIASFSVSCFPSLTQNGLNRPCLWEVVAEGGETKAVREGWNQREKGKRLVSANKAILVMNWSHHILREDHWICERAS